MEKTVGNMSVGEEPSECPLCMELLEIDDINFFPCTCGYQVCRFCWHRIRTDENGLCPACRKQYPEDPAEFKPLTEDEVQNIKKERKQKESQRKQKAAENRKHLANVRVVQKNLVFVVGLSPRLADTEVLKKQEYFGKFGKIHKVVINQSTAYAGSQGPSASAYVTYMRVEDALRAILTVNNVHVDGRTLKTSLGTTKYCSNFLRSSQCTKNDCMYLHELGEEAASFTKEEMQMGKHQEYEQKLIEQFHNTQNSTTNHISSNSKVQNSNKKSNAAMTQRQQSPQQDSPPLPESGQNGSSKPSRLTHLIPQSADTSEVPDLAETWPSLQPDSAIANAVGSKSELLSNGSRSSSNNSLNNRTNTPPVSSTACSKTVGNGRHRSISDNVSAGEEKASPEGELTVDHSVHHPGHVIADSKQQTHANSCLSLVAPNIGTSTAISHSTTEDSNAQKSQSQDCVLPGGASRCLANFHQNSNSLSFFSNNSILSGKSSLPVPQPHTQQTESYSPTEMAESIPVTSTEDWSAAFGFDHGEDDLEFDPCTESFKGLADLIEKENGRFSQWNNGQIGNHSTGPEHHMHTIGSHPLHAAMPGASAASQNSLPPGFSMSHIQQQNFQQSYYRPELNSSRMMDFMNFGARHRYPPAMHNNFHHHGVPDIGSSGPLHHNPQPNPLPSQKDVYSVQGMQEALRSMLPNVNISFGSPPQQIHNHHPPPPPPPPPGVSHPQSVSGLSAAASDTSHWPTGDPAIVCSRTIGEDAPHWMKSIHQLTETDSHVQTSRLPFAQRFQMNNRPTNGWPPQMQNPPPGFRKSLRPNSAPTDHTLAEALQ